MEESYIHIDSGLRYCPVDNYYYTWVSENNDDFIMLSYYFMNGVSMLFQEGELGKRNEDTMKDEDWDRCLIFIDESKGFQADLEEMFMKAIDKYDSENSST